MQSLCRGLSLLYSNWRIGEFSYSDFMEEISLANGLIINKFEGENFGDLPNSPMFFPTNFFHYTV